jgi:hypothetical protein
MIIAVDFDGTIVEHKFPEIGEIIPMAFEVLKEWQGNGHKLILWTCRNNTDPALKGRKVLDEAIEFCKAKGLVFDAVNENIKGLGFCPKPKVYADWYIDDRANKGFVEWLYLHCIFYYKTR